MTTNSTLTIEDICVPYKNGNIQKAAQEFGKLPNECPVKDPEKSAYYCTLEKSLSTLWENVEALTEDIILEFFRDKQDIEHHFIKFLFSCKIKALPNVAQRSGATFLIINNELKKTWTKGPKNVDGWLNFKDTWVPYDVKKHNISCLGFTFSELRKYLTGHNNVIFVVYDKQTDNGTCPEIILSLSHLCNNPVFTGLIEDFREINGVKKKIITGDGIIVPKDSEYALFKTQTYLCKNMEKQEYVCPQFNDKLVRIKAHTVQNFSKVLEKLIS